MVRQLSEKYLLFSLTAITFFIMVTMANAQVENPESLSRHVATATGANTDIKQIQQNGENPVTKKVREQLILKSSNMSSAANGGDCRLILTGNGPKKINVIKKIRELTNIGLTDAKKLVDNIPAVIVEGSSDYISYCATEIEAAGGSVDIQCTEDGQTESPDGGDSDCSLILTHFGSKKINVIKEVRGLTGLGLKDAKELVEGVPVEIVTGSSEYISNCAAALEGAGGSVDIQCAEHGQTDSTDAGAPVCSLILTSPGPKKINVIKVIRGLTGLGLKDAKELVDSAPVEVMAGSSEYISDCALKIKEVGGVVNIQCHQESN